MKKGCKEDGDWSHGAFLCKHNQGASNHDDILSIHSALEGDSRNGKYFQEEYQRDG